MDVARKYKLINCHRYLQSFTANDNEEAAVKIIEEAAQESNLVYQNIEEGFKWGEDFGLFTQNFKGAMFGIGAGENCPALHQEDYDFPDALIETGKKMFVGIINIISAHHSQEYTIRKINV
jgi:metal-dependent amidase/aminoacylase/carboxypeptidase family protein